MRALIILAVTLASACAHSRQATPVIDVHRHATWPWNDDAAYLEQVLAEKDDHGIVLSLISVNEPDDLEIWGDATPGRFMIGAKVPCPRHLEEPFYVCFPETDGWADLEWLRTEVEKGRITLLHEVAFNYFGLRPDDPRLAPYWALAAEFDLPVGVHTGRGPGPRGKQSTRSMLGCCPDYDKEMGNPELLRPILDRHPGLRVWIQHVGSGRGDHSYHWNEAMALLADYPNVYLDLSITNGVMSEEVYEATLKRLIEAGFGDRIMYGADNVPAGRILDRISRIDFLSQRQRRAILYDNAARFLRLDEETRRKHRQMAKRLR